MLKTIDFFSGIGGFSYGLEHTGRFQTVAFSEIAEAPSWWLSRRWPDIPNLGDITKLDAPSILSRFGYIDLFCGGFPCQDISVAGQQEGLGSKEAPTRSGLFYKFAELIYGVRPTWILLENVAALKSNGYDGIYDELQRIGYTCWPTVVSAESIGSPHRRERVWIVGLDRDQQLGDPESDGLLAAEITRSLAANVQHVAEGAHQAEQSEGTSPSRELADPAVEQLAVTVGQQERVESTNQGAELADAGNAGLQGRVSGRSDQERQSFDGHFGCGGTSIPTRWVARPGEPQHGWEELRITG